MISEQGLKERIHKTAEEKGVPFNISWKHLLFERFLCRLSASEVANQFIFKGGLLLSFHIKIGRETSDLDFLVDNLDIRKETIEHALRQICLVLIEDGFVFSFKKIELLSQPHMEYDGFRVSLNAKFGRMVDTILVDIGVGDIVTPKRLSIPLTTYKGAPIFEKDVQLFTYPLDTIFAEKLETILSKGPQNSRMKDYHDLLLMIRQKEILELTSLQRAIQKTCQHRGTKIATINFDPQAMPTIQNYWSIHLKDLGSTAKELQIPKEISSVIEEINLFLQEVIFK